MEFVLGQRWVSQTETELGLGIVVATEGRHVTVRFPVAEEDRVYARTNSPLARVLYVPGDNILDTDQSTVTVVDVEDLDGLKCYLVRDAQGGRRLLPETQISGLIHLSTPKQRFFSGQFGNARDYALRIASLEHRYQLQQSLARGLLGVRASLLPHQIYIAHEVASRFAPRVLLADEVGLGKTIEAGMILHHQLQTGLASRALIIVPDALLHQWLVEMLRKFGLRFALFDQERYEAVLASEEANPFESEQLVLCGLSMLAREQSVVARAVDAGWDLVIVDEAHHLEWTQEEISAEYAAVQELAQSCAGLLLLTATPEQLGMESHFARLRLLDPSRFNSLETFVNEQRRYVQLNEVVRCIAEGRELGSENRALVNAFMDVDHDPALPAQQLVEQLLDRHGTGRVLFRNTRAAISGFPQRVLYRYPLAIEADDSHMGGLHPEQSLGQAGLDWLSHDPRVAWLEEFYRARRSDKILLICAHAQTAIDLEKHLHLNVGVRSAAFYEDLSIIERDRAAAYFADDEAGAQTLICSEIGSEGRNFQFSHHLVLFDLPMHPDLLEQRIGRLDRIGQTHDVQIHVPYLAGTGQEVLFRWYHEGLDAFCRSFSAGAAVRREFAEPLQAMTAADAVFKSRDVDELVAETARYTEQLRVELHNGRDQLLELNSCRADVAEAVISAINNEEQDSAVEDYVTLACDAFGVEPEYHSEHSLILKPTEQMLTHGFPYVGDEGLTVTFDREKALVREDMEFISWEAPLVSDVMEMVLGSDMGNTNISTISIKALPPGTLLVECFYAIACSAPKKYQISRFLPFTPVRVLLDSNHRNLTDVVKYEQLNKLSEKIRKSARPAILREIRPVLEQLLIDAEEIAQSETEALQVAAQGRVHDVVGNEVARLRSLQAVNPSIRSEEIDFLESQQRQALAYIEQASMEPQAIRVVIAT